MGVLDRILRAGEGKKLKALEGLIPDINAEEAALRGLSNDALAHKTVEFRERLARGETLDDLLVEAFAVVREAAGRTIGQRHYDVQMMGGAALHFGWIAEMKTGEGKTLVWPNGACTRSRPTTIWLVATRSGWVRFIVGSA
jgi:preprotein translocase subunit SecA